MDTYDEMELSRWICAYLVDPTPPRANPLDDCFYPLEETPVEDLPLEGPGVSFIKDDQEVIYGAPGDRVPPPVNARRTQKRKRVIEEEEEYVKKPPNAFMLYRQEQRPKVLADLKNSGCAAVNTIIGQMWKALSQKQQQTYYEDSGRLRQIHSQLYPDWSSRDNYGKKRKRSRRRLSRK